jgi:hypothetical protein
MTQQDEQRVSRRRKDIASTAEPKIVPKSDGYPMNFASDNTAGIAPAIDAIVRANAGFAPGYGDDATTAGVERRLSELFEREVAAFLVPTGTAANALAIAQKRHAGNRVLFADTAAEEGDDLHAGQPQDTCKAASWTKACRGLPKSSGTRANLFRASASSSPT